MLSNILSKLGFGKANKNENAIDEFLLMELRRADYLHSIQMVSKLFALKKNYNVQNINSLIKFRGIGLDSINLKSFEDVEKKDRFIIDSVSGIPNHKIIFFKIDVYELTFSVQLHFINDNFFFLSNKVSSFVPLSNNYKQMVIDALVDENLVKDDSNNYEVCLKDSKGNTVYTEDNVHFYVNYLANNPTTQQLKKEYSDYVKPNNLDLIKKEMNTFYK